MSRKIAITTIYATILLYFAVFEVPYREATTRENMVELCGTLWWAMEINLVLELSRGQKVYSMYTSNDRQCINLMEYNYD